MAYWADSVRDNGLAYATANGDRVYICDAEPTDFTEATATYALGVKTGITIGAPTNGVSGRKVVISGITGGTISVTDTATHYAVVDFGGNELIFVEELAAPVAVTNGNTFSLTDIDAEIPAVA